MQDHFRSLPFLPFLRWLFWWIIYRRELLWEPILSINNLKNIVLHLFTVRLNSGGSPNSDWSIGSTNQQVHRDLLSVFTIFLQRIHSFIYSLSLLSSSLPIFLYLSLPWKYDYIEGRRLASEWTRQWMSWETDAIAYQRSSATRGSSSAPSSKRKQ